MPEDVKVKLVATGFPWLALLVGIVVLLAVTAAGLWLGFPLPGVSVVAALSAFAAFAAMLRPQRM
ncbi:MAG: hypothetical protein H7Y60_05925 [Rhodospirillaceae bacterium]|nr:hypothetical protein [Rhodospirillales bacterium]